MEVAVLVLHFLRPADQDISPFLHPVTYVPINKYRAFPPKEAEFKGGETIFAEVMGD